MLQAGWYGRGKGGDCATPGGGAVLHGEPGGVTLETTIHDQVGQEEVGGAGNGALLCLQALLPQADALVDEHAAVGFSQDDGDGVVWGGVRDDAHEGRAVGTQVHDLAGQQA